MIIESKGAPLISGIQLRPGKHNYPAIDHKDPVTALQLKALEEIGVIKFSELVDARPAMEAMDDPEQELVIEVEKKIGVTNLQKKSNVRMRQTPVIERIYKGSKIINPKAEKAKADVGKSDKPAGEIGQDGNTDKRGGRVSSKSKN